MGHRKGVMVMIPFLASKARYVGIKDEIFEAVSSAKAGNVFRGMASISSVIDWAN